MILFAATLFWSAFLLFCVQPLVGKMLLPTLGGAPSVWNTCLVFFQGLLLAAYAYAHWMSRHPWPHVGVLLLPVLALPLAVPTDLLAARVATLGPSLALLTILVVHVGLPFFALATTAPLLQSWFSRTSHSDAKDPYFLYAASNVGSLGALALYPFLVEPFLTIKQQTTSWAWAYALLPVLVVACAWKTRHAARPPRAELPGRARIGRWVLYSAVPSSLLVGVTTYLSTDVAALPLLWVAPLFLYLLTFVLVFSKRWDPKALWPGRGLALFATLFIVTILSDATDPAWLLAPLHLTTFFFACLVCHGALAKDRPAAIHLTAYYLSISLGGFLGGAFNTFVAPLIFRRLFEYPLAILVACWLRARGEKTRFVEPAMLGLGTAALILLAKWLEFDPGPAVNVVCFAFPSMVAYSWLRFPRRFALALGAVWLAGQLAPSLEGKALYLGRNFFGTLKVSLSSDGRYHYLMHGRTLHGQQSLEAPLQREPMSYYSRKGPAGEIFEAFNETGKPGRVGIIGLGTGSVVAFARPHQDWDLYEINPLVVEIASDDRYFTYLRDSSAKSKNVLLGDARLKLQDAENGSYGLILIDAFSSDAIPTHLVTKEAFALYFSKLRPEGVLLAHVSNRHVDLKPLVGALAKELGIVARWKEGDAESVGVTEWIALSRDPSDIPESWAKLPEKNVRPWTDDYSSLVGLLKL